LAQAPSIQGGDSAGRLRATCSAAMRLALLTVGIAAAVLLRRDEPQEEKEDEVRVLLDGMSGAKIRIKTAADDQASVQGVLYVNCTLNGEEFGCVGCDPNLFKGYVTQQNGGVEIVQRQHMLTPTVYYQRRDNFWQMWKLRRLVIGNVGSLTDLGFTDSLVDLARASPRVFEKGDNNTSRYNSAVVTVAAEIGGKQMRDKMQEVWPEIESLAYVPNADAQNKESVAQILKHVKTKFEFYRARCLLDTCTAPPPEGEKPQGPPPQTTFLGTVACSEEDSAKGDCVYAEARRCESPTCGFAWANFPRFHGLAALLEVKRGRCSELSRVAYGMLLALGYDSRMVIDFTDHVWVEVRVPRGPEGTWYHGDPSEGVFNKPLMYEKSWGKQLTFVFGVTPHSIEDISKTYTADYPAMVQRRGVGDEVLLSHLKTANHRIQFSRGLQHWGFSDSRSTLEEVSLLMHFG